MAKPSTPIKKKPAPKKPAAPPQAAEAFDRALPEIEALSPDRLITINLDIPRAVSQVLGVLPGLLALRPAIAEQLPKYDLALLDRLETCALAAWHAHLAWLSSRDPGSALKPLLAEAVPLRENLLGDAEALARRGLLDAETVAEIRAGQGHIDTANDLVALSALFSGSWSEIAGRTAATEEEVRRAGEIGPRLLAALGVREHGAGPGPTEAAGSQDEHRSADVRSGIAGRLQGFAAASCGRSSTTIAEADRRGRASRAGCCRRRGRAPHLPEEPLDGSPLPSRCGNLVRV